MLQDDRVFIWRIFVMMKKAHIHFFVLAVVCVMLSFLLLSCKNSDKPEPSTESARFNSSETILLEVVTAISTRISRNYNDNDIIRHQKDFIEFSRDTLERINEILYADYLVSEESKTGEKKDYFFTSEDGFIVDLEYLFSNESKIKSASLFFTNLDGTKIFLGNDLTEKFVKIIKRVIYGYNFAFVAEGRVTYIFGTGTWKYIYTVDGKPPTYYVREGDRNRLFPSEESLGGNWYFVDSGGRRN